MQVMMADPAAQWKPVRVALFVRIGAHVFAPVAKHRYDIEGYQGEENKPYRGFQDDEPGHAYRYRKE